MYKIDTHTRIIEFKGSSLFVRFEFNKGDNDTNTPPCVELHEVWHNDSEITELLEGTDMIQELEEDIFEQFKEDFYVY
jgi:hypothetical protein